MAIDLDALRRKHAELNGGPAAKNSNSDFLNKFYQIPEGTNSVRVLPGKEDAEFYAETKIHRITGPDGQNRNFHCRKVHGEACPICDLYYGLWKTGKQEDEDLARKIKPRSRYYMNILDRNTEDVKILSIGVILFKKIIGAMVDPDFGDITDLTNGHDFKIVKEMEAGSPWPKYDQSAPRPKSTPLGTAQEMDSIMGTLHDIHALVKLEDYDACKEVVAQLTGLPDLGSVAPTKTEEVDDGDYLSKLQS